MTRDAEISFVKGAKKHYYRLDPDDIKLSVKALAEHKGASYTALLGMWIKVCLAKESKYIA